MVDRPRNLRVQLSDAESSMLHAISDADGVSTADVVRAWITDTFRTRFGGRPLDEALAAVCDRARFYVALASVPVRVRADLERRAIVLSDGKVNETILVNDFAGGEDAVYHRIRTWSGSRLTERLELLGVADGSAFDFGALLALHRRWHLDPAAIASEVEPKGRRRGK